MKHLILCAAIWAGLAASAQAQTDGKAEIRIQNNRQQPVTMRFSYAIGSYSWKLAEKEMPVDTDLTYRFPTNIPGCEKLHAWGVADGVLSISIPTGTICVKKVNLCDSAVTVVNVREQGCGADEGAPGAQ